MPLPNDRQYHPPNSWTEFEDLCCELFEKLWADSTTEKHGRLGQSQGGVDIFGKLKGSLYTGVQCKNKSVWPPQKLTTKDIDEEVKKAKTWTPGLYHYIVATTARNDVVAQKHARLITAKHKKRGLFSVEVMSWDKIVRKLTNYPDLLRKYGYLSDLDPENVKLVVEETIRQTGVEPRKAGPTTDPTIDVAEALEKYLESRYLRAVRRSLFPEAQAVNEFATLADIAQEPSYGAVSSDLRRRILLRASRSEAVRGSVGKATELLNSAQKLKGHDTDLIARARILECKDVDAAIALLRDETDADARSTLFNILVRHRSLAEGLQWLNKKGIEVSDLTVNGIHTLATTYLQSNDFDGLRPLLDKITQSQLSEAPYFLVLRALVNIACILPIQDRRVAMGSFQLDARSHSILDVSTTASRIDGAIRDLSALLPISSELELPNTKRLVATYIAWCELLHPHRRLNALAQLRRDMQEPKLARERLSLAFAFDTEFNPGPIGEYLNQREELGGLDDDDLRASLILGIHSNDPASVAALIARHRARFEATYKDPPIFSIEIQALASAGETASARLLLEKHRADLGPEGLILLESYIAKAEGEDPVAEDLKAFEATKSVEALQTLVGSLIARKDHRAIAKYAEELFNRTRDLKDITNAAHAFAQLGDGTEFCRVIEAHPDLEDSVPQFRRRYAWELFHQGRLREAKTRTELLAQKSSESRDLQLEIAIAVESGEWETIAKPLSAFLENVSKHSGLELIRAAHIAQQSGQGPMKDLVKAAVSKAGNNPHVWLGAYTLVMEEGLEEEIPDAHLWFRKALELSDKKGPVQQFELKELVPQQVQWNKRTRDISERITRAEMPLVIAASGLRITVVDMLLRNLVRNSEIGDARKKVVLPLFSGHRAPTTIGPKFKRLGIDVSSLLVLGWLGLLPKVFMAFEQITLPASVLTELFEGRRRVQQVQKSRIRRARELDEALRRRGLKVERPIERTNDPLSTEVGPALAALIRAAEASGGTLLRPGPVHRPGLDQIVADVTGVLPQLSDMHALLKVLSSHGIIDQIAEETAKHYFDLQDRSLPGCATPDPDKTLYVDELALVYLQYTNLLGPVLKIFKDVRIEGSSEDEALAIIEHQQHVEEVLRIIDDIRVSIKDANGTGQIAYGTRHRDGGKLPEERTPSTLHLLSDLSTIDAVVCDDRSLNKENFAADNQGRRIPCLTTLDILDELRKREKVSELEWSNARHRLRIGGAALTPITTPEVVSAARRSHSAVSAEMRSIQQSIDLARIADVPSFPREMPWFARTCLEMKSAIIEIWKVETDAAVAAFLSSLILNSIPRSQDWQDRWQPSAPADWSETVERVMMLGLAAPVQLADDNVVQAFNRWFEVDVMGSIRAKTPRRYETIVEHIRSLIMSAKDDHHEGENNTQLPTEKRIRSRK